MYLAKLLYKKNMSIFRMSSINNCKLNIWFAPNDKLFKFGQLPDKRNCFLFQPLDGTRNENGSAAAKAILCAAVGLVTDGNHSAA